MLRAVFSTAVAFGQYLELQFTAVVLCCNLATAGDRCMGHTYWARCSVNGETSSLLLEHFIFKARLQIAF